MATHGFEMAILQDVDKCVRCNGCVISCKRTWHMSGLVPTNDQEWKAAKPNQKLGINQRVVIKSQSRVDSGPFVRFSCWHCDNPPCAGRCPFKAIKKHPVTGAVYIDPTKCNPDDPQCHRQCKADCQRGGVPMVGAGCDLYPGAKSWKCTLCTGVDETGKQFGPYCGAGYKGDLPTKAPGKDGERTTQLKLTTQAVDPLPHTGVIEEYDHQPACVFTCPAKAMIWDTRGNIEAYLKDTGQGWTSKFGDGSMYWVSKKYIVSRPKADPFIEDHISPMVSAVLSNPLAKAAVAPTLVAGAVLAIAARRAKMDEELSMTGEER